MAAAITAWRSRFAATHFLSLPLYNSKSKSQLESFAHSLRNDEYAEGIHQKAFRFPAVFHIPVAEFKLESGPDVKAALDLLRRLDIQRILKDSAPATTQVKDPSDQEYGRTETSAALEAQVSPLQVSLTGVTVANIISNDPTVREASRARRSKSLYGGINDPSDRLRGLMRGIRRKYASGGFRLYSGPQDSEEAYVESRLIGCALLEGNGCKEMKTFVDKISGSVVRKRVIPDYDATALCQRYENAEIAKDIIIENFSLCKEGRVRAFRGDNNEFVADEYYEEIDSISMPQKA